MPASSVESQLLTVPISQLDLADYCLVTADTTVRETVEQMRDLHQNCAIIVGKGTHIVGILTDRDVLKRVVTHPETWDQSVESVMTEAPDTIRQSATTGAALHMMEDGHYRNVPVVNDKGVIRGNVTYYAILKFLTDHFADVVYNLPPDPTNFAQDRHGG
ncbi:MAG: CBS domain-containing protein [Chloroflexota bacterium]